MKGFGALPDELSEHFLVDVLQVVEADAASTDVGLRQQGFVLLRNILLAVGCGDIEGDVVLSAGQPTTNQSPSRPEPYL